MAKGIRKALRSARQGQTFFLVWIDHNVPKGEFGRARTAQMMIAGHNQIKRIDWSAETGLTTKEAMRALTHYDHAHEAVFKKRNNALKMETKLNKQRGHI